MKQSDPHVSVAVRCTVRSRDALNSCADGERQRRQVQEAAHQPAGAQRSGRGQGTVAVPVQHRLVPGREAHHFRPRRRSHCEHAHG